MSSSLPSEPQPYRRAWRSAIGELPPLRGQTVLDLGCGGGEQASALVARGARVIGIDLSDDAVRAASSRGLPGAEFRVGDLRSITDLGFLADGIWSSYSAAYFPDLPAALSGWRKHLRPGGWIALTEIDDLFGHEPLGPLAQSLLEGYAREALAAKRYDFHMGRKLGEHLVQSGFTVLRSLALEDQELSFTGPGLPEVIEAWRSRFERMGLLRDFCGSHFEEVREEFLAGLRHPGHRSIARVCFCLAIQRSRPARHGAPMESLRRE